MMKSSMYISGIISFVIITFGIILLLKNVISNFIAFFILGCGVLWFFGFLLLIFVEKIPEKPFQLLSNEDILIKLEDVFVFRNWVFAFQHKRKKVLITNMRIIVSFSWFGVERMRGSYSYYFKSEHNLKPGDSVVKEYELGDDDLYGEYIKLKHDVGHMKIYTDKNKEIEKIIKEKS